MSFNVTFSASNATYSIENCSIVLDGVGFELWILGVRINRSTNCASIIYPRPNV